MDNITLMNKKQFELTINRLAHEVAERHGAFDQTVLIGIQPRGAYLNVILMERIQEIIGHKKLQHGKLDITFFRDDFGRRDVPLQARSTQLEVQVENKNVILVDDVLYTGRTISAALNALGTYGRPNKVELLVLINRRFSRQLPIEPDYVGRQVDAIATQRVNVEWSKSNSPKKVTLFTP